MSTDAKTEFECCSLERLHQTFEAFEDWRPSYSEPAEGKQWVSPDAEEWRRFLDGGKERSGR